MQKAQWQGNALLAAFITIPLFGCVMAVHTKNMDWLTLLAPLVIFMEAAFILLPTAYFVVSYFVER